MTRNRTLLLVVVCLAQFMVVLDVSIVNIALPAIRTDLGFSTAGLQWVVNTYTLTFAGFLMLGGRAADLLGRRRMFLVGTGLFTFASLVCAVSSSAGVLLGARALQGVGGAVLSPATLAIVMTSFAEGRERNRALGVWAAMAGLGASTGAVLGGLLTESVS
jgi:MFS family permease